MKDSNDIDYYELPPSFAADVILPMYEIADGITKILPQMTLHQDFDEDNVKLKAKLAAADSESIVELNHKECLVMCQMMGMIKFYYHYIIVTATEVKDNLSAEQLEAREVFDELIEQMLELGDDIFEVFPDIREPFYADETNRKKQKDEAKTLGLNKTKVVTKISVADPATAHFISTVFAIFEFFIFHGVSEFSERVREADFCCVTEIHEVRDKYHKAVETTKRRKTYAFPLSLRDIVVLLMLNSIFQKLYFSDAGDELQGILEETTPKGGKATGTDARNYMLKMAKAMEDHLFNAAIDTEGFEEVIRPILDFPV